jgi:hypothetical protein
VSRRGTVSRPILIWLVVILAHTGLIAAILLSRPQSSRGSQSLVVPLSLLSLPSVSSKTRGPKFAAIDVRPPHFDPGIIARLTLPPIATESNAITLSPTEQPRQPVDWDHESALAVQSSLARTAKEKSYRDLSSLTPEQLDWIKKNHLKPVPGFQWDRSSRREMLRHGIIKLSDYCVLIVVIPLCSFGGKIQYNGDLFGHIGDPSQFDQ